MALFDTFDAFVTATALKGQRDYRASNALVFVGDMVVNLAVYSC
jgi:hypothetical protein